MKRLLWPVLPLLLAAGAPAPIRVTLAPASVRRLGIVTAPAVAVTDRETVAAIARVLDAGPLAQLDADLVAAQAAAAASSAEATRARALHAADAALSLKAAQAATAQARSDVTRVTLLKRRLSLEWSPAIAAMRDGERTRLIDGIARGRVTLVRIESAGGTGLAGLRSASLDLGAFGTATATVLGPTRTADPRLQSQGVLTEVAGPKAQYLPAGLGLTAHLATGSGQGVFVPAGALLRLDGQTWIFVQTAPRSYERRALGGLFPRAGGIVARSGVRAGERIVTDGASQLHAAEPGAQPADPD